MKSAIPGPATVARRGAACRSCVRLPFLICALFALSGCAYIIGPILDPIFEAAFGSGVYLGEVSRAFREETDRWPRDFDELIEFCEAEDLLTFSDVVGGKGARDVDVDLFMFKDVRFNPRPDGSLELTYSFERRRPRANGANGEATVHCENASVIVSLPDDDAPSDGGKTGP